MKSDVMKTLWSPYRKDRFLISPLPLKLRSLVQAILVEVHLWMRAIPWMERLRRHHPIWMVVRPMVEARPRTGVHPLMAVRRRTIPPRVTVARPLMAVRQRTIPLRVTVAHPLMAALPVNSGCRQ